MIAGVISFGPSQETPPNGSANVCAPIADLVGAGARRRRRRTCRPSSVVVESRRLAAAVAELRRSRREGRARPARPCRAAAAGLEVAPDDAGDRARLRRRLRPPARRPRARRRAGSPVRPSSATPPGCSGVLQRRARLRRAGERSASTGCAPESTPGGLNASCDDADRPR